MTTTFRLSSYDKNMMVNSFSTNGFIHLKSLFSKDICKSAVNSILDFEDSLSDSNTRELVTEVIDDKVFIKYFQGAYNISDSLRKFFSSTLLGIGSQLLNGSDVYFADLEAHIRNPGGGEIPKHQDNFYFNLKEARGMTCYIALTDHDTNSGGLNYISSTHKSVLNHEQSMCPGFSSSLDHVNLPSGRKRLIYSPEYEVGDVSIHHPNNIHFSHPLPASASRKFALSARIFAIDETRDQQGIERYQRLLKKNRK